MRTVLFANPVSQFVAVARPTWRQRIRNVVKSVREAICGLLGHDFLIHFDSNRICLECAACGHQTPGWSVAIRPFKGRQHRS